MSRSTKKGKSTVASELAPSLTAILGSAPVLPGEAEELYRQGLQSLIEELEAKTVMQVYLTEKIYECLWWMRRYEQQKRATLAREMARILCSGTTYKFTADEADVMDAVLDNEFDGWLDESIYSEQSLRQEAFSNKSGAVANLNEQIAVLAKTLAGFQASYEVLANRKLNTERLRLQNELIAKDLSAIELKAQPDVGQS